MRYVKALCMMIIMLAAGLAFIASVLVLASHPLLGMSVVVGCFLWCLFECALVLVDNHK